MKLSDKSGHILNIYRYYPKIPVFVPIINIPCVLSFIIS
ncbi:MAG: hypothetical protein BAJALOKI1v1_2390003 [Promethearchaeota archaeon]|nr:MAG: hypothetical protein BAJALOKI1v1_2390003 [Candidatus Lokiarchaeota archaeon]